MLLSYLIKYRWVLGVIAALASVYAITDHYEQKGYNRAVAEIQLKAGEELLKATDKLIAEASKENQKALDAQSKIFDNELARVKLERVVETEIKEVITYVDKVEIRDECNTISDDVYELLNESVRKSNRSDR